MSTFRKAREEDLPQIMAIIAQAQAFLASRGVDQWQDGYPDEARMRADIADGTGYVLEQDGKVAGIATLVFDGEQTYDKIYDGAWATKEPYACIHRIAVNADLRGTGTANTLMQSAETIVREAGFDAIRIDTHRDNITMQRMLARNGYTACGTIYLEDGAERVALEKQL